jgi:hypothetical protein
MTICRDWKFCLHDQLDLADQLHSHHHFYSADGETETREMI